MISWKENKSKQHPSNKENLSFLHDSVITQVLNFHKSYHEYRETPLTNLSELSTHLGVNKIYVKDESYRFHLNSFKVLGGFYAIAKYIGDKLGLSSEEITFDTLKSPEVKKQLGQMTFASATDGNHGRGVAWAAQELGHKAVIYMPTGSSHHRLQHIKDTGAEGYITDWNYDDTVRYVANMAEKEGWVVVQDTAWEGYEEIPMWIMQGYAAIAKETIAHLQNQKEKPTHLFLQAGVGSFAAAILGYFVSIYQEDAPMTVIVEPTKADCFYQSFSQEKRVNVSGDLHTIMAGLACGEPNEIAWEIIRKYAHSGFSCPDEVAATGMRVLGNPLGRDHRVISGESGAVTMGLVYRLLNDPSLATAKEQLKLDSDSTILLINTEGDTDPEHYRKIVWEGTYSSQTR